VLWLENFWFTTTCAISAYH